MAADTLSDLKLVIKAEKDWCGVRRPQVAMHLQLPPQTYIFYARCRTSYSR